MGAARKPCIAADGWATLSVPGCQKEILASMYSGTRESSLEANTENDGGLGSEPT